MTQLNANIILAGRPLNMGNALATGTRAAAMTNQVQKQNRLSQIYDAQGPGIMAGEPNALNALAQVDPQQALGFRATQQSMSNASERLNIARAQGKREAMKYTAELSSAEAQQQILKIERGLKGAAAFYDRGDREGFDRFMIAHGLDPQQMPFDDFLSTASQFDGIMDALNEVRDYNAGPEFSGNVPAGHMLADPSYPRAGVIPIPGAPGAKPKTRTKTKLADGRYYWDDSLDGSQGPTRPQLVAPELEMPGQNSSEAEQKIARIMENLNTDEATAIAIVDGVVKTTLDPVTREVILTDMRTGQPWQGVDGQQGSGQTPAVPEPRLNFGEAFTDTSNAFGAEGFGRNLINKAAGAFGANVPFPETLKTQNDFAILKEGLINEIASSYGRQPPSWLLKNIEALTPEAGKFWAGAADAESKLESIGRDFERAYNSTVRQLSGRALSPDLRLEFETRQAGLDSVLNQVQQALDSFNQTGSGNKTNSGITWSVE